LRLKIPKKKVKVPFVHAELMKNCKQLISNFESQIPLKAKQQERAVFKKLIIANKLKPRRSLVMVVRVVIDS